MTQHKIIFSGPVGAGKTTAIGAISDVPPVTTEVRPTDGTVEVKPTTTVAMDYGVLKLDGGDKVHLYGTPGQERFDFMWDILSEGAIGVVLLISNTRPVPLSDLRFFLEAFRPVIERTQLAVGVTGLDVRRRPPLTLYRRALVMAGLNAPVFEVDARRQRDVALLVQALLLAVDPVLAAAPLGSQARSALMAGSRVARRADDADDVLVMPGAPRDYW